MVCKALDCRDNLKSCLKNRPPLVLFTIGLFFMGGAFVYLAYYVSHHDKIPNPNLRDKWNNFLDAASQLDWCLNSNSSLQTLNTTSQVAKSIVAIVLPLRVPSKLYSDIKNFSHYNAAITRGQLFKTGSDLFNNEMLQVLFYMDHSNARPDKSSSAVILPSCVTLKGQNANSLPKFLNITAHDELSISCSVTETSNSSTSLLPKCSNQLPHFKIDGKWTTEFETFLSLDDKNNINLHLMFTSYFLLVTALSVIIYGLIRGKGSGK